MNVSRSLKSKSYQPVQWILLKPVPTPPRTKSFGERAPNRGIWPAPVPGDSGPPVGEDAPPNPLPGTCNVLGCAKDGVALGVIPCSGDVAFRMFNGASFAVGERAPCNCARFSRRRWFS